MPSKKNTTSYTVPVIIMVAVLISLMDKNPEGQGQHHLASYGFISKSLDFKACVWGLSSHPSHPQSLLSPCLLIYLFMHLSVLLDGAPPGQEPV